MLPFLILLSLFLIINASDNEKKPALVFIPGWGTNVLNVTLKDTDAHFLFVLDQMLPNSNLGSASWLRENFQSSSPVKHPLQTIERNMKLNISNGNVHELKNVHVEPVSFGKNFSEECPRKEYLELYHFMEKRNVSVYCAPFDFRLPVGTSDFDENLTNLLKSILSKNQVPSIACHSQGCLFMAHYVLNPKNKAIVDQLGMMISLAGQYAGCSDCMLDLFHKSGLREKTNDYDDYTWPGEFALGLQKKWYGDHVLWRTKNDAFTATNFTNFLSDVGADDLVKATEQYNLKSQKFYDRLFDGQCGPVCEKTVAFWGDGIPSDYGYGTTWNLSDVNVTFTRSHPYSTSKIWNTSLQCLGDGGENCMFIGAPGKWETKMDKWLIPCTAVFNNVSHFGIVDNADIMNWTYNEMVGRIHSGRATQSFSSNDCLNARLALTQDAHGMKVKT